MYLLLMVGLTCPLSHANELDSLFFDALNRYISYLDETNYHDVPDKYYIRMVDLPVELNLEEHPRLKEYSPGYINGAIYRSPESTYECDTIEYIYSLVGINGNEITMVFSMYNVGLTVKNDLRYMKKKDDGRYTPIFCSGCLEGIFYKYTDSGWKIDKHKTSYILWEDDEDEEEDEEDDE